MVANLPTAPLQSKGGTTDKPWWLSNYVEMQLKSTWKMDKDSALVQRTNTKQGNITCSEYILSD